MGFFLCFIVHGCAIQPVDGVALLIDSNIQNQLFVWPRMNVVTLWCVYRHRSWRLTWIQFSWDQNGCCCYYYLMRIFTDNVWCKNWGVNKICIVMIVRWTIPLLQIVHCIYVCTGYIQSFSYFFIIKWIVSPFVLIISTFHFLLLEIHNMLYYRKWCACYLIQIIHTT